MELLSLLLLKLLLLLLLLDWAQIRQKVKGGTPPRQTVQWEVDFKCDDVDDRFWWSSSPSISKSPIINPAFISREGKRDRKCSVTNPDVMRKRRTLHTRKEQSTIGAAASAAPGKGDVLWK